MRFSLINLDDANESDEVYRLLRQAARSWCARCRWPRWTGCCRCSPRRPATSRSPLPRLTAGTPLEPCAPRRSVRRVVRAAGAMLAGVTGVLAGMATSHVGAFRRR